MTCEMVVDCFNITSARTKSTYGILGRLDCSSFNIIYVYQCMYCHKQYVGETESELRVRNNGHRHSVSTRNPSSALFTHLETHRQLNSHYLLPSVEDYYFIIPIEQLPTIGGYAQDKLALLNRETYWIDTLGTLEPSGLNKKRCEDFTKPISNNEIATFVVAFSGTANMAIRIMKKHYEKYQKKEGREIYVFDQTIITAYTTQ